MRPVAAAVASPCAGFTLIEMMIALVLLSFLGLLLAGSIGFGGHASALASARGDRLDRLWTSFALIRGQIATAYPPGTVPGDAHVFTGEPDALVFTGPAPARLPLGGDQRLTLRIDGVAGARRLVAIWRALGDTGAPRQSVLIDGLRDGTFAYLGASEPGGEAGWQSDWSDAKAMPRLVRLTAAFADGMALPALIAAPHISRRDE
jgi:general secretion pathway protein J